MIHTTINCHEMSQEKFQYIYIYIYIRGAFNKFPDFFVQAFKIVVDASKFTMLLLYILCDDWPIFMISGSNEQLQQQLEYTLLKPDCHSWWISKMKSGHEETLEEGYAIKICFKLGKNAATETYGMLQTAFWPSCMNRAPVFEWHKRFKEVRESVRNVRGVGGVRKSEPKTWLAKGLEPMYIYHHHVVRLVWSCPSEKTAFKFVLTFPAMSHVSCPS